MKSVTASFASAALLLPLFVAVAPLPLSVSAAPVSADSLFPFVMGGAGPNQGITDVSWLNEKPAGKNGFVTVKDGHFVDGAGRRIRFLATNFTFGSAFPSHEEADALAVRLASMGINCIRFHHMDKHTAPAGIWLAGRPKLDTLDPAQLDKLDYFIAQLKKQGIYADLNLHVSRQYWEGATFEDGIKDDSARNREMPKYGKGLDKINDRLVSMQRDYARDLLTHVNPYTGLAYVEEPSVVIVEINNENSLFDLDMESLPEFYRRDIQAKWNDWLRRHYADTAELGKAWGRSIPLGNEMLLSNPCAEGREFLKIDATSPQVLTGNLVRKPDQPWKAQLQWRDLTFENGQLYTLSFAIRSDVPRTIRYLTRHQLPDWEECGLSGTVKATATWTSQTVSFVAEHCVSNQTRIDFVMGNTPTGKFEMKDVSLRIGGARGLLEGESLEQRTVGLRSRGVAGTPRGADWFRFIGETERAYVAGMKDYLRTELKCRALLIDSQASYGGLSGVYRESLNDFVDMHSYWQHPSFSGTAWDPVNWSIKNTPMSSEPRSAANLGNLAAFRVAAKPFTVTEYDHPAPSHSAAEMFPMVASFAGAQDWDGIFQFDWGGAGSPVGVVGSYFALQNHPAKLAFLPAAALLFRRGDVPALSASAVLEIPAGDIDASASKERNMPQLWSRAGFAPAESLNRRQAVRFDGKKSSETKPEIRRAGEVSGVGAIQWTEGNPYQVDVPTAKIVVGPCGGRTFRLQDFEIAFAKNASGFASMALLAVDGKPLPESRQLLLTVAGDVENTGMGWNPEHTSVGRAWGRAPTVCEGIGAKIVLKTKPGRYRMYALDGKGHRQSEVPLKFQDNVLVCSVGPEYQTLWYEVVAE